MGTALLDAVGDALGKILEWIGTFLTALLSTTGVLNPLLVLFAVGIAVSVVLLSVKIVKRLVWGA